MDKLNWFTAGASAIAGIAAVWVSFSVGKIESDLNEVKNDREFRLKIHDLLAKSLSTGEEKNQLVAVAFINEIEKPELRCRLLRVVIDQGKHLASQEAIASASRHDAAVKNLSAGEKSPCLGKPVLDEQTKSVAKDDEDVSPKLPLPATPESKNVAPQIAWRNWDIDTFFCENNSSRALQSASEKLANKIKEEILAQGAQGRIRVKILPERTNRRDGYRVSGFEIRHDSNRAEIRMANNLQIFANYYAAGTEAVSFPGSVSPTFQLRRTGQGTNWYLSLFVCPNALD